MTDSNGNGQQVSACWPDIRAAAIRQAWDELPAWTPGAVLAIASRLGLDPAVVKTTLIETVMKEEGTVR